jgi:hypothetical protein
MLTFGSPDSQPTQVSVEVTHSNGAKIPWDDRPVVLAGIAAKLKETLIALAKDALGSLRDLLPIVLVISAFQLFVFREPITGLTSMATGVLLVVAGLTFFIYGLRLALFPIGEELAHALAEKGSVFWLVGFAFLLGFGTTIAEPALIAIAAEAAQVAANAGAIATSDEAKDSYALGLRLTVALAVGAALVLGVMRILADWSLPILIIAGYCLVLLLTTIAPKQIVGIAYDSGGVTTSTVTVPLVTALGVGLASSLKGRNPMTDGFGLIAFASLTPILFVLAYGIVVQWT